MDQTVIIKPTQCFTLNERLIPDDEDAIGGETPLINTTAQVEEIGEDSAEIERICDGDDEHEENSVDGEMSEQEFNEILNSACAEFPDMDELIQTPPTTPNRKEIPPGSLLSDEARPPSPTNITDFPYYEPWVGEDQNIHVPVRICKSNVTGRFRT
jgi:hypothetical protein